MMKQVSKYFVFLLALSTVMAVQASPLTISRHNAVNSYLDALGHSNSSEMVSLFSADGVVYSTSEVQANAVSFFQSYFPLVASANVQVNRIWAGAINAPDFYSASFSYQRTLKNGINKSGHYTDEFVFKKSSSKLKAVYMYENLKF